MTMKRMFKVSKKELNKALQALSKVVSNTSTLPILTYVHFDFCVGTLTITGTNLDETLQYSICPVVYTGGGKFVLPLKALKDALKGKSKDVLTFTVESQDIVKMSIQDGMTKQFKTFEVDEFPSIPSGDGEGGPSPDFLESYRKSLPFASTDETRHLLNGVFFEVPESEKTEGLKVETVAATDGRRLVCWSGMDITLPKSIIVPRSKFLQSQKIPDPVYLQYSKDRMLLCLRSGPYVYHCKIVEGMYPNFRQVIPKDRGDLTFTIPEDRVDEFKGNLSAVSFKTGYVKFSWKKKGLTLLASDPDEGDIEIPMPWVEVKGTLKDKYIGLNPICVRDAVVAGFREFNVTNSLCPTLSKLEDTGTHVLMPIRIT